MWRVQGKGACSKRRPDGEDPWCEHKPDTDRGQGSGVRNKKTEIIWEEEASERLKNVPVFLRSMVKKGSSSMRGQRDCRV